ncbi:MAG: hypothetical protein IKP28_00825 [Clostridia bacterium]|nr:hypothetical protein [Clostridia bacterium]
MQLKQKKRQYGKSLKVRLASKEILSCKIVQINEEVDGSRVIFLETSSYSQELVNYRKLSMDVIWWSDEGLKIPNSAIQKEGKLNYVIRNRAGYMDKILVKVLRSNNSYSIVTKYKTDELKELGFTQNEIINMKSISLYDEILINVKDST